MIFTYYMQTTPYSETPFDYEVDEDTIQNAAAEIIVSNNFCLKNFNENSNKEINLAKSFAYKVVKSMINDFDVDLNIMKDALKEYFESKALESYKRKEGF